MATKRVNVGKVIGQVGGLRVRQTETVGLVGNKTVTKSTTIGIYTGKKMIETGFKNKESAIALGAYWRYGDALCPGVLFEIKDYAIGITYDLTASKLLPATNTMGAIEITFRMQSNNQFLYKGYNPK